MELGRTVVLFIMKELVQVPMIDCTRWRFPHACSFMAFQHLRCNKSKSQMGILRIACRANN